MFIPVKSAVSPPAELNKPLPGDDVELAKEATSYKGTKNDTTYYNLKVNWNLWFEADNLTDLFLPTPPTPPP